MADNSSLAINFSYQGETHSIDVNTLVNSQTYFLSALTEISRNINSDVHLKLKIEAVKQGSFELNQIVEIAYASGLFIQPAIGYLEQVFSTLSDYISIASFLKGEKAEKTIEKISTNSGNEQKVELHLHGDNITVSQGAFTIYQTNGVLDQSIIKMGQALVADRDVDGLKLTENKDKKVLLKIEKQEFKDLTYSNAYLDSDTKEELKTGEILYITKADINPKKISRWNFIYNNRRISGVAINDPAFLAKVKEGIYKFGNGDALKVNLKIIYKMDKDYNVFLENKFEIASVIAPLFINKQGTIQY